jgi:hypothetical protein
MLIIYTTPILSLIITLPVGGYGKVMRSTHRVTNEVRAVKIMEEAYITPSEQTRLKYEFDILKNLNRRICLQM